MQGTTTQNIQILKPKFHIRAPDLTPHPNIRQISIKLRWTHPNSFFPLRFPPVAGGYSDAGAVTLISVMINYGCYCCFTSESSADNPPTNQMGSEDQGNLVVKAGLIIGPLHHRNPRDAVLKLRALHVSSSASHSEALITNSPTPSVRWREVKGTERCLPSTGWKKKQGNLNTEFSVIFGPSLMPGHFRIDLKRVDVVIWW